MTGKNIQFEKEHEVTGEKEGSESGIEQEGEEWGRVPEEAAPSISLLLLPNQDWGGGGKKSDEMQSNNMQAIKMNIEHVVYLPKYFFSFIKKYIFWTLSLRD